MTFKWTKNDGFAKIIRIILQEIFLKNTIFILPKRK